MLDLQKPVTLNVLLFGDDDISYDENTVLYKLVNNYIVKSNRFS